jgi:hypothetical protein
MTSRLSRAVRREQRLGASTEIAVGLEDSRQEQEDFFYDSDEGEDLSWAEGYWCSVWSDERDERSDNWHDTYDDEWRYDDDGYYDDEHEDWLEEDVVEAFMTGHSHPDLPEGYDFNISYEDRLSAWEEHEFQVEMQQAYAWPRLVEPEPEVDTRFPVGGYSKRIRR